MKMICYIYIKKNKKTKKQLHTKKKLNRNKTNKKQNKYKTPPPPKKKQKKKKQKKKTKTKTTTNKQTNNNNNNNKTCCQWTQFFSSKNENKWNSQCMLESNNSFKNAYFFSCNCHHNDMLSSLNLVNSIPTALVHVVLTKSITGYTYKWCFL